MREKKPLLFLISLIGAIIALGMSETLVRISGRTPWVKDKVDSSEPRVFEYDDVLGWRNREGSYTMPAYSPGQDPTRLTILKDGTRATKENGSGENLRKLVIIGGSFTFGWAVSDAETYPWKLQDEFFTVEISNYGSNGYGTYQSLLVLERLFASAHPPAGVIYGFMGHHEERNVAPPAWVAALSRLSERREKVAVPFCTIDTTGMLVRHPPESYPVWPFRQWFALVPLVQEFSERRLGWSRHRQKVAVTERLFLEMQELTTLHRAGLAVVLLQAGKTERAHYTEFLQREGIGMVDCVHSLPPEMRVLGEGHPNGEVHTYWADCIARDPVIRRLATGRSLPAARS